MSTQQPGWYTDPLGHADRRWYDGTAWTASVLDAEGRQGVDQLPAPTAPVPVEPSAPAAGSPTGPASSTWAAPAAADTWAGPAGADTWAGPAGADTWAGPAADARSGQGSGQPRTAGTPALPAVVAPAGALPRQAPPARPLPASPLGRVALGLVGVAVVALVLSLFVLDWVNIGPGSASFGDLVPDGASAEGILDTVALWHYRWLGYVVAAVGVAAVVAAVIGGFGHARPAHVAAAIVAAFGVLLSTFAIVRYFRGPGADPELGAWLLPAAFVVLLAAVVVSARRPDER